MDYILRIISRLRAYDPLPGDHRGTFRDDRSSDLPCERRLSEQLRPRLPRAFWRPRDLPGHPHRGRPRQQGQQSAGRHPASRARAERFRGWDTAVAAEVDILRDLPVACVISDISVIGIQVGEQLGVRNIGIANFTWCEQYEFLGLSDTIIDRFREVYAKLDLLIEYDLMLPAPKLSVPRKQTGFICRRFDSDRIAAIKAQYGPSIFITCGKSASLLNIQIDNYDGTIFTSPHHHITTSPPHHHITSSSHHHITTSPHHHIITSKP